MSASIRAARSSVVRAVPLFLSDGEQFYPDLAIEALRVAQGASTYVRAPAHPTGQGDHLCEDRRFRRSADGRRRDLALCDAEPGRALCLGTEKSCSRRRGPRCRCPESKAASYSSAPPPSGCRTFAPRRSEKTCRVFRCRPRLSSRSSRAAILSRPDWADGLEILSIAVLGFLLVIITTFVSPRAVALVCGLAITAMALVASWCAFLYAGLLFDPLAPIISGSITHFAATSFRILVIDRERREVRRAFGHYLSPSLLHRIEHTPDARRSLAGRSRAHHDVRRRAQFHRDQRTADADRCRSSF